MLAAPRPQAQVCKPVPRRRDACCVVVQTPKYGIIFHASLVGQAAPKFKGKIARVLAAKCSLSVRVDALGEQLDPHVGIEGRATVRARSPPCCMLHLHNASKCINCSALNTPQRKVTLHRTRNYAARLVAPTAFGRTPQLPCWAVRL